MGPAEEAMRKSIALSSGQYSEALFLLAGLLTNSKRFPEAEVLPAMVWRSMPPRGTATSTMARALSALKRPEEAERAPSRLGT